MNERKSGQHHATLFIKMGPFYSENKKMVASFTYISQNGVITRRERFN